MQGHVRSFLARVYYPESDHTLPFSLLEPLCRLLLLPLSWGYAGLVVGRGLLYKLNFLGTVRAPVPVVSVGNLTTGGTGKTPVVISIVQAFQAQGKKVVVLSRGYGAKVPLAYGRATNPTNGDEAAMIQAAVPEAVVIVGRNRAQNALRAVTEHKPDVIVLDDGFQYWRLQRDLDIVLVDGQKLLGNRSLLPAGPLRESMGAFKRAQVVLLTKIQSSAAIEIVENWVKPLPVIPISFQTTGLFTPDHEAISNTDLQNACVIALCAIAHPDQFVASLRTFGLAVEDVKAFADHHRYSVEDVEGWLSESTHTVFVTTEKDWVKFQKIWPDAHKDRIRILKIAPYFDTAWFYEKYLAPIFAAPSDLTPLVAVS